MLNRRHMAVAVPAALVALRAESSIAAPSFRVAMRNVAQMTQRASQGASTSEPTEQSSDGASRDTSQYEDLNAFQSMYAGVIATWADLGAASMESFADAVSRLADNPLSNTAAAQAMGASGVWSFIYADMQPITAPEPFVDAHELLLEAYRSLDRANIHMVDGLTQMDAESITKATEFIELGNAAIDKLAEVTPIAIPDRSEILPG